jgi:hypothetical protein
MKENIGSLLMDATHVLVLMVQSCALTLFAYLVNLTMIVTQISFV